MPSLQIDAAAGVRAPVRWGLPPRESILSIKRRGKRRRSARELDQFTGSMLIKLRRSNGCCRVWDDGVVGVPCGPSRSVTRSANPAAPRRAIRSAGDRRSLPARFQCLSGWGSLCLGNERIIVVRIGEQNLLVGSISRNLCSSTNKQVVIMSMMVVAVLFLAQSSRSCAQVCEGNLLHGRTHGARLSPVSSAHPRRRPHARQSQPEPSVQLPQPCRSPTPRVKSTSAFESIATAVGDPAKVGAVLPIPGLHRQDAVERYLASKQVMSWSVDFMADDWTRINSRESSAVRSTAPGGQGQRHPAAARHPARDRARPPRTAGRTRGPRLSRRACRSIDAPGSRPRSPPPDQSLACVTRRPGNSSARPRAKRMAAASSRIAYERRSPPSRRPAS